MTDEENKARENARRIISGPSKEELIKVSVDGMINEGTLILRKMMTAIANATPERGMPARDTVATFKDCMAMLHELKKKEKELASSMSEDEVMAALKRIVNNETKSSSGNNT